MIIQNDCTNCSGVNIAGVDDEECEEIIFVPSEGLKQSEMWKSLWKYRGGRVSGIAAVLPPRNPRCPRVLPCGDPQDGCKPCLKHFVHRAAGVQVCGSTAVPC